MTVVQFDYFGLRKIISGGQTGADRGGIDAAKKQSIETGGWAPYGYRTDVGPDRSLADLGLQEHSSPNYPPRTKLNVVQSDATVIIASNPHSPGCTLTAKLCKANSKPLFVLPAAFSQEQHSKFVEWIIHHQVGVLNVAGNRDKRGQIPPHYHYDSAVRAINALCLELSSQNLLLRKQ